MSWQSIDIKNKIVKILEELKISYQEERDCSLIQMTPNSEYDFGTTVDIFIWYTYPHLAIRIPNPVSNDKRLQLFEFMNMLNRDTQFSTVLLQNNPEQENLTLSLNTGSIERIPSSIKDTLKFIGKVERALDMIANGNNPHAVYLVCEFED